MLFTLSHRLAKCFPRTSQWLLPAWLIFKQAIWKIRNIVMANRPVSISVGRGRTVQMLPEGHIAELMWSADFEPTERDFVIRSLKPGMCVLNIGANAGLYTLIASKLVSTNGEVHAFEPSTRTFALLQRNIAINGVTNAKLSQIALSNFKGRLQILRDPSNPGLDGHFFVQRINGGNISSEAIEVIPCDTIDNYWREVCNGAEKSADLIIIDVEGAELSVFQGAAELFRMSPNLVMMMECTKDIEDIGVLLSQYNFRFFYWNIETGQLLPTKLTRGTIFAVK